jgi:hypothetical protein
MIDNFVMYPKCKYYNIALCNTYIQNPPYNYYQRVKSFIQMKDAKIFAIGTRM